MKKKIIIFASGNGSNAENITRFFQSSEVATVHSVLCNRKEAGIFERFKPYTTPCLWFDASSPKAMLTYCQEHQPDLIVLAGYLKKIPEALIARFPKKIINIHPALLPSFGGKGMYGMHVHEAVYNAKATVSGISIHYVNKHYDEGAIIYQAKVQLAPQDTPTDIAQKVQALEYRHYPVIIQQLLT